MASKTVIVTGVTSGIGLRTSEVLLESGYTVVGVARSVGKGSEACQRLQARCSGSEVLDLRALDVRDIAAVRAFVADAAQRHGRINALVNAAGVLRFEDTHQVGEGSFHDQFDTLFTGPFFLTAAILQHMLVNGGGVIVNIGSVAAQKASPKMAVYAAAKAALVSLTKTIALEYANSNIRAICIHPGAVQTHLMDKVMFAMIQKKTPLKRIADPHEVAALVRYVLSDEATYMTGSTIVIDGGSSL